MNASSSSLASVRSTSARVPPQVAQDPADAPQGHESLQDRPHDLLGLLVGVFTVLMLVCAAGMWRLRYWAVLGFMALLAIIGTLFSLYLVEASNALGFIVAPVVIVACGYLFFRLVRVLSRIQMPERPGS